MTPIERKAINAAARHLAAAQITAQAFARHNKSRQLESLITLLNAQLDDLGIEMMRAATAVGGSVKPAAERRVA